MRPEPISTWILKAQIIALPTQPEEAQRSAMGSDLEYADEVTLSKALEARREL